MLTQTAPAPPGWLNLPAGWRERKPACVTRGRQVLTLRVVELAPKWHFSQWTTESAGTLSSEDLREATARVYESLLRGAGGHGGFPLRFWNYIPGITAWSGGPERHRYMVFNRGRAEGMAAAGFAGRGVAASAVGFPDAHRAPRLTVQMLAGPEPAEPLENPRQVPAWRYSKRYGKVPPTFARASVLPGGGGFHPGTLLLAGTAAVVGEDSVHAGDLAAQAAETCTNLAVLVGEAAGRPLRRDASAEEEDDRLAQLRHLRVYVSCKEDFAAVEERLAARCGSLETLTLMHAPLCRPELLLEAEGVSVDHLRP